MTWERPYVTGQPISQQLHTTSLWIIVTFCLYHLQLFVLHFILQLQSAAILETTISCSSLIAGPLWVSKYIERKTIQIIMCMYGQL